MKHRILLMLTLLIAFAVMGSGKRVIKVLAIGNSFSEDAVEQYLYELAAAQGDSLVIGNAYIGGCSIDRHWGNAQSGKPEYRYRKIIGGKTVTRKGTALGDIIRDDDWDIISLQQASHFSGLPYTFSHLHALKDYVTATCPNKQVAVVWHMTWAYARDSKHKSFRFYRHDQQHMFRCIVLTVAQELPKVSISRIIPTGLAIQYAREQMGDVLCRDGFHLNKEYGRYLAACTWCEFLTGRRVTGNPYRPASVDAATARIVQRCAHRACRSYR